MCKCGAGLLGGAVYVNAFTLLSREVEPRLREFSLAAASLADSVGIALADITGILIQVCPLCPDLNTRMHATSMPQDKGHRAAIMHLCLSIFWVLPLLYNVLGGTALSILSMLLPIGEHPTGVRHACLDVSWRVPRACEWLPLVSRAACSRPMGCRALTSPADSLCGDNRPLGMTNRAARAALLLMCLTYCE
jgi:hypothetical protein